MATKPWIVGQRPGGQAGRLVGPAQRLPERDPLALGERVDAASTARSPMPRLGVLRIRRSETSSAGLTSIRR